MIEVLKQALEALELHAKQYPHMQKGYTVDAITSLRQALEQPAEEPVAWQVHPFDYGIGHEGVYARTDRPEQVEMWKRKGWTVQPLYTRPQPAAWVGLTDEEMKQVCYEAFSYDPYVVARAIEAKLKEKNT